MSSFLYNCFFSSAENKACDKRERGVRSCASCGDGVCFVHYDHYSDSEDKCYKECSCYFDYFPNSPSCDCVLCDECHNDGSKNKDWFICKSPQTLTYKHILSPECHPANMEYNIANPSGKGDPNCPICQKGIGIDEE